MDWALRKIRYGLLVTTTSGGTLALSQTSVQYHVLTGTSTHAVRLPDATQLKTGIAFTVINDSTQDVTVEANDTSLLTTVEAGNGIQVILTDVSTAAGVWAIKQGSPGEPGGITSNGFIGTKTSDYTILAGDDGKVIPVNTSSGAVNLTLPSPVAGFKVTIKDVGYYASVNQISVTRSGAELIDGNDTPVKLVQDGGAISLISNGTHWFIIDGLDRAGTQLAGRGLVGGGVGSGSSIVYVDLTSYGDSVAFGSLTVGRLTVSACGSATRALFGGGYTGSESNVIDYVEFATLGNAVDFGDMTLGRGVYGAGANSTRGIFAGGSSGGEVNNIDYINIATLSNAIDFGDLITARYYTSGVSSPTRMLISGGLISGGSSTTASIEYVQVASASNASSFANLSVSRYGPSPMGTSTKAVIAAGQASGGSELTVMDYLHYSSLGNAADFGTIASGKGQAGGCSSSHGGLYV